MIVDNSRKFEFLRQEYNVFIYERFDYDLTPGKIRIKFTFNLSDKHLFEPEITLFLDAHSNFVPAKANLENLIFQIGMIELISYWKACCSPEIIIRPFLLDQEQISFWKKIYYHGLGEFFYLNGLNVDPVEFVTISSDSKRITTPCLSTLDKKRVIVPVGGGKDSSVTLELLKGKVSVIPFVINPTKASIETIAVAGFKKGEIFRVERRIHTKLLELNTMGFLNGHTPFSAVIGFISLLAANLSGSRYVALSNESSANEPTVSNGPNHQYSKSYAFESDFRNYVQKYICPDIKYFSFLRPLSEMGIASIFSRYPKYFSVFNSCNVGSKEDIWCGRCPKCLFTAIILSPFISREDIIKIFNDDILDNKALMPVLESLIGSTGIKPFECIGTMEEVNLSLVLSIRKIKENLPSLLSAYMSTLYFNQHNNARFPDSFLIEGDHFLEEPFFSILKNGIDEGKCR